MATTTIGEQDIIRLVCEISEQRRALPLPREYAARIAEVLTAWPSATVDGWACGGLEDAIWAAIAGPATRRIDVGEPSLQPHGGYAYPSHGVPDAGRQYHADRWAAPLAAAIAAAR